MRSNPPRFDPWQRRVIVWLVSLVLVSAIGLILLMATRSDSENALETTTTTTTTRPAEPTSTSPVPTTAPTSTTATTTTAASTTTTISEEPPFLTADAIGVVVFGTPAEEAVILLVDEFGPPDEDTGWVDQQANYGICLGDTVRFVRWGSLRVFLTDGASEWAPAGKRHLAAYGHGDNVGTPLLELETRDGLAVGTPVGDMRAIYGDRVTVEDDPLFGPFYSIDFPGSGQIFGELSGTAPDDRVISIAAGFSCGE